MTNGMRWLAVGALYGLLAAAQTPPDESGALPSAGKDAAASCNSLTGPFCAFTGLMEHFAAYMTPIAPLGKTGDEGRVRDAEEQLGKACFFQHHAGSWMDSGGDAYDLMNQKVATVDECEQLCCEHAQCRSFTFWRGHTCFLRGSTSPPRPNGDSFSGIRLM